jgi:hypothetical protein
VPPQNGTDYSRDGQTTPQLGFLSSVVISAD